MPKITKKYLIEEAIKKYTPWKIKQAKSVKVFVTLKSWWIIQASSGLGGKKDKAEQIKSFIRSILLNRNATESNKREIIDTSSENIESIKIRLRCK